MAFVNPCGSQVYHNGVCVCVYIHVYVCRYVCVYIYIYIYMNILYTHVRVCVYIYIYIYVYMHKYVHICRTRHNDRWYPALALGYVPRVALMGEQTCVWFRHSAASISRALDDICIRIRIYTYIYIL